MRRASVWMLRAADGCDQGEETGRQSRYYNLTPVENPRHYVERGREWNKSSPVCRGSQSPVVMIR